MKLFRIAAAAAVACWPGQAQLLMPVINSVVDAASYRPGLVPGEWATLLGSQLAHGARGWQPSDFLGNIMPTSLDSIGVRINGIPTYVSYISDGQINFLVPDTVPVGDAHVQVTMAFSTSGIFTTQTVAVAPSLFAFTAKYPVAAHNADGSYAGPPGLVAGVNTTPAKPGEIVQLYGTGFGPGNPPAPSGLLFTDARPVASPVTVTIGGMAAAAAAYLVGPGVYQVNVTVPLVPDGDAAIVMKVGTGMVQDGLSLNVAR